MILKGFLHDDVVDNLMEKQMNKYLFWLYFSKEKVSNGLYTNEIQKYVHKEYLAWTGISLVGNVGGQLGLWVGFSFTGFLAGTLNVIPNAWNFLRHMWN